MSKKKPAADTVPADSWMSTDQVCEWMNVEKDWLYDRVAKKGIPHVKVGRLLRFKRSELEDWIEGHRQVALVEQIDSNGRQW